MNKIKRTITSLAALLLFSGAGMAVPLSAHAEDSNMTANPPSSSDVSQSNDSTSGTNSEKSSTLANQFRELAQQKLQEKRKDVKAHTEAEREKSCNARKASLEKRMANAVTQAERHKKTIDEIYTKVKNFYTTKNLSVANYSTLTANVDTAQANAQASIDALKGLDVNVDCTSQTVADSVSTFQQAVSSTRDSLKSYRTSLVALITAIKGDSTSTDKTNSTNQ